MSRPNWRYAGNGYFLVRTQAGFKQALKHFVGQNDFSLTQLEGFPRAYPSVVRFSWAYRGCDYVQAHCVPLDRFKQQMQALLDDLQKE